MAGQEACYVCNGTTLQCNAEKILPRMRNDGKLPQNEGISFLISLAVAIVTAWRECTNKGV